MNNKRVKKIMGKMKRVNEKINRVYQKLNKVCLAIIITVFSLFLNSAPVCASGDFGSSVFAKGTEQLIKDIGTWLLILAPIAGSVVGVYFFIRRSAADEMDQKKWNDRIKTTVISTVGAVLVSALIVLIASYYGKSVTGI